MTRWADDPERAADDLIRRRQAALAVIGPFDDEAALRDAIGEG